VVEVAVNDSESVFEVMLTVQPRVGDRSPKAKLARGGNPLPWLSSTGREVVQRLLAADRTPSRIDALNLSPTEMRWSPRNATHLRRRGVPRERVEGRRGAAREVRG
jgi:hypothetical protein